MSGHDGGDGGRCARRGSRYRNCVIRIVATVTSAHARVEMNILYDFRAQMKVVRAHAVTMIVLDVMLFALRIILRHGWSLWRHDT
jgi:hypothetical protein